MDSNDKSWYRTIARDEVRSAEKRNAERYLQALLEMQPLLSRNLSPRELLAQLPPALAPLLPDAATLFALARYSHNEFEILGSAGEVSDVVPSRTLMSEAVRLESPVFTMMPVGGSPTVDPKYTVTAGTRWILAAPMLSEEHPCYIFFAVGRESAETTREWDRLLLAFVATTLTQYFKGQRAAALEQAVTDERDMRLLAEARETFTRQIASTLDAAEVVQRLLSALQECVGVDAAAVVLKSTDRVQTICIPPDLSMPANLNWLFRSLGPQFQVLEPARMVEWPPELRTARLVLGQKLLAEDALQGVLLVASSDASFSEMERRLLDGFVEQAGMALQNAVLHQTLLEAHQALAASQAHLLQSTRLAAVGQLAAGVAHELNTPLGAVLLGVESILLRPGVPPQVREVLRDCQHSAQGAQETIAKLLRYSRKSSGEEQACSLVAAVENAVGLCKPQLELDGVRLTLGLFEVPPVRCHVTELQQVAVNLLINAREALVEQSIPHGEIYVETRVDPRDPDMVLLEVADNGAGIPQDMQRRIFDPFFTTKPTDEGSGLGLFITREIVTDAGGTVTVESRPGRTLFRVALPSAD